MAKRYAGHVVPMFHGSISSIRIFRSSRWQPRRGEHGGPGSSHWYAFQWLDYTLTGAVPGENVLEVTLSKRPGERKAA